MGYYSDVRIIVSGKGYDILRDYVKTHALEYATESYDYNLLNHCEYMWEKDNGNQIMLGWNYIKWYDYEYPDIELIKKGLRYIEDNGYSYRFSRIGESYEDIEEACVDGESDEELDYISIDRHFDDNYNNFNLKVSGDNEKEY